MDVTSVGYLQRVVGLATESRPSHVLQRNGAASSAVPNGGYPNGSASAAKAPSVSVKCVPVTAEPAWHRPEVPCPGCFLPNLVEREGHPPWRQPTGGVDKGLRTYNSVTGEKEPFVPLEGQRVRWYTCGPTVYDVAHMGHARAYLTFDILRRIMSKHFGYDLFYQINITDIDDKIILRSRQNKLFEDFAKEAEGMDEATVRKEVQAAVDFVGAKLEAKKPKAPEASAPEREQQEYTKLSQEFDLKLGQHAELQKKVAAAASKAGLLEAARDPLMAKLDKAKGSTVNDHSIFYNHARKFEDTYFEDMDALGVLRPDVTTRITDYMDGRVQKFIEKLTDIGVAYESRGSVYFSIDEFNKKGFDYRKLVPAASTSAAEMEEGEGALAAETTEKRNPNDFALWKASKPGEPDWDPPRGAGRGRPGWHIECSVMATDVQGEFLDIHAGGEDLKFPHHDNEMAQSEAYLNRAQWCNYWWHAGHLHIEGLKMSKSLKNFITIRQALQMHSARQLRMMFLMQPWDKGMNYSDQAIDMAREVERKTKHFLGRLRFHQRRGDGKAAAGHAQSALDASTKAAKETIDSALADNFNTGKVVDTLSRLVSECYAAFDALPEASLEPVARAAELVESTFGMLGVENLLTTPAKDEAWAAALDAMAQLRQDVRRLAKEKDASAQILEAAAGCGAAVAAARASGLEECASALESFAGDLRSMAEAGKPAAELLRRCDQVRDRDCIELGVRLEDLAGLGFVWMFDSREALEREVQEQAEKAAAAAKAKLANKLRQKQQEIKSAEKASTPPEALFSSGANAGLYSAFDDAGVPTKLADGSEVSAKKRKDFAKELEKQKKEFEKLSKGAAAAGGVDALLAKMRSEAEELERQIGPLDGA